MPPDSSSAVFPPTPTGSPPAPGSAGPWTNARHRNVPGAIAQIHQVIPGALCILNGSGKGMLRCQPVFKAQGFPARGMGELGGQGTGIAQVAAGIAAAVAVENDLVGIVTPLRLYPGSLHTVQLKRLPTHADHGGDQSPQQLLTGSLALQILLGHGFRRGGRVDRFERAHHQGQTFFLCPDLALLLAFNVIAGGGLFHAASSCIKKDVNSI